MNPQARAAWRRRSLCNSWTFYLWAVSFTVGLAVLAYLTLRSGLEALLTDPSMLWMLAFCAMMLIQFWRGRPRRPRTNTQESIRLNLD